MHQRARADAADAAAAASRAEAERASARPRSAPSGETPAPAVPPETSLAIVSANFAFYAAMRDGDAAAMRDVWHRAEGECSVIYPGQRPIVGRADVLSSWDAVLGQ